MVTGEKKNKIRRLNVRYANFGIMGLSVLLYAALLIVSFQAAEEYRAMKAITDLYVSCQENAGLVTSGSDYLTEQVRLFTFTLKPEYMDNYFHEINVDRRRDLALEQLEGQASETAMGYLSKALDRSNQLTELEIYAIRLAAEGSGLTALPQEVQEIELFPGHKAMSSLEKIDLAREKVFGEEYQAKKALINDNVEAFIKDVMSGTQYRQETSMADLNRAMTTQLVAFSLLLLLNILIFVMISLLIVKPLKMYVRCIHEDSRMSVSGAYEFKYMALTYNDIYELGAASEMLLQHRAEHDPLTGILNQAAFDQLKNMMRLKPRPIALLLIDIDKFSQINHGYGHDAGDKVLKLVAKLLKDCFRASDYPARIGGDRFAVVMDEMSPERQEAVCQKVRNINRRLAHPGGGLPPVSVSVGGAFSPGGFTDQLYIQAEEALRLVKETGPGRYEFHKEDISE